VRNYDAQYYTHLSELSKWSLAIIINVMQSHDHVNIMKLQVQVSVWVVLDSLIHLSPAWHAYMP